MELLGTLYFVLCTILLLDTSYFPAAAGNVEHRTPNSECRSGEN
jgi:hypothetical protein